MGGGVKVKERFMGLFVHRLDRESTRRWRRSCACVQQANRRPLRGGGLPECGSQVPLLSSTHGRCTLLLLYIAGTAIRWDDIMWAVKTARDRSVKSSTDALNGSVSTARTVRIGHGCDTVTREDVWE